MIPQKSIIQLEIKEIKLKQIEEIEFICNIDGFITVHLLNKLIISESNSLLELWYPREYGNQKLYDILIQYKGKKFYNIIFFLSEIQSNQINEIIKKIGFRKIKLVQDLVDFNNPEKGQNFYFEVNDIPIFLKGKLNFVRNNNLR